MIRALPVAVLLASAPAQAAFDIPALTGPVVDRAGLLDEKSQQSLAEGLRRYRKQTGHQLQVLIINSLEGIPIEEYSIRTVEAWQLGTAEKDNGVLLLVAVKDRKWRIEVGGGLEGDLPDALASRIGSGILVPHFREGNHAQGIASTLQAIAGALGGELHFPAGLSAPPPRRGSGCRGSAGVITFFFLILLVLFGSGRGRGGGLLGALLFGSLLGGFGGRGRFGGGGWSGGGGGWSGGGGGFSGGGASGSW